MAPSVAIVAPGNMGAGVARRLTERGVHVVTLLTGRSPESLKRAKTAGMVGVSADALVEVDLLLSIVPPANAVSFAEQIAFALKSARRKPVFVDCNAVSPTTVRHVDAVIAATGADFVDAGIIGFPPPPGTNDGPHIYASGKHAAKVKVLGDYGLDIRVLAGPIGAASALKMAYAGVSKGTIAIVEAMVLAATRAGCAESLHDELASMDPHLLDSMTQRIPRSFSKAWRWGPEMQEIAEFAREDPAAHAMWMNIAKLYERLAADLSGDQQEIAALKRFFSER
jgi:3-hydroxyisobutyrate dehydrogenase-like beta-hydroxyacid dehydrogenase